MGKLWRNDSGEGSCSSDTWSQSAGNSEESSRDCGAGLCIYLMVLNAVL